MSPRRCTTVNLPGGGQMIACGTGRREKSCSVPQCGRVAVALCDQPVGKTGTRTCSKRLCEAHRTTSGKLPDGDTRDLCPAHAKQMELLGG